MPESPTLLTFDEPFIKAYHTYYNDSNYKGYKYTFTFNPRKYTLVQAWTQGIDQIDSLLNSGIVNKYNVKYYLSTVEKHKNFFPHVHGVLFLPSYEVLNIETWIKNVQRTVGRLEFQPLMTDKDYEQLKSIMNDDSFVNTCWLTYITKELIVNKELIQYMRFKY